MTPFVPLEAELARVIRLLQGSDIRLSLMSLTCTGLGREELQTAAHGATHPADIAGLLPDGSIGILSMRGPDGGAEADERFIPRLWGLLTATTELQDRGGVTIYFRTILRRACGVLDTRDLLQALYDTPVRTIIIAARPYGLRALLPGIKSQGAPQDGAAGMP